SVRRRGALPSRRGKLDREVSRLTASERTAGVEALLGRRTIPALWRNATARPRTAPPYLVERDDGRWVAMGWEEAERRVDELANGLLGLGIRKGDAFGTLASTRVEWCVVDFALALVGGVTAPVYANSSPRDCAYILGHSEAIGVLVEDETQRAKVDEVRGEL